MSCVYKHGQQLRSVEEEGNKLPGFQSFLQESYGGFGGTFLLHLC